MKYVGSIKPFVPVNAFLESIYEDECGVLYTHEYNSNRQIVGFDPISLEKEDVLLIENSFSVTINSQAVFSFVNSKNKIDPGAYNRHIWKYTPFLISESNTRIARLLISSFFCFHGYTSSLINSHQGLAIINLKIEDFLPSYELKNDHKIYQLLSSVVNYIHRLESIKLFSFFDFIYVDKGFVYLSQYKIPFNIISSFINRSNSDSDYSTILLDVFIHYKIFDKYSEFIDNQQNFSKELFGLSDLVRCRTMMRDYKQLKNEKTSSTSFASMNYRSENILAESQKIDKLQNVDPTAYSMKNEVKEAMKKRGTTIQNSTV